MGKSFPMSSPDRRLLLFENCSEDEEFEEASGKFKITRGA